jgi:hypothetical protein
MAPHKSECPAATEQNANLNTYASIVAPAENLSNKLFATLQARFALRGHTLEASYRADDLCPTFWVSRWGQARAFSGLHDVQTFLAQIGGTQ